jgi:gluconokinase
MDSDFFEPCSDSAVLINFGRVMSTIVVMGVAGCGKSSLGAAVAEALALPLIEGDDFHSTANRSKMAEGTALTDADRDGWLDALAAELQRHPDGAVLTCSALKRRYRERLRAASPGLRFVFMAITPAEAESRVAARAARHFFNQALVASQFDALEPPLAEAGVLALDATRPLAALRDEVVRWLNPTHAQGSPRPEAAG